MNVPVRAQPQFLQRSVLGKISTAARKLGYVILLVVLTMILFGPALPIDMAILLASSLLAYGGFGLSKVGRATILATAKARLSQVMMVLRS